MTRAEWIIGWCKHRGHSSGTVNLRACASCGAVEWSSTSNPDGPFSVNVIEDMIGCRLCEEARHRSPEIVEWVGAVVTYQLEKAIEKMRQEKT